MQFLLANPAWLWLLSLAAVPLLVHLFARSNPPKYLFSSTEFLRKILKKTARVRKPKDWLLLLLRTLAALALLFIFLQPLLTSGGAVAGGRKTSIYLIDRSASMTAKDGASSRFAGACAKAVELLDAGSVDEANVVWIDAVPDAVFPQPGPNLAFLQDALKRSDAHEELGAIGAAVGLASSQLELAEGGRELVVISDFQAAAWKDFELQVPKEVEVVKVKVGAADVENVALQELFANPAEPVVGQDVVMVCRLRNFSATPRRATLYLESGGGRQSRAVEIPAWGAAEANFSTRFTQPGLVSLTASIAEDAFSGDDATHALVRVRDALQIASLGDDADASEVLARLAGSLEWLEHITLTPGSLPQTGAVDYLFVHAWDGENVDGLRALAESGTSVLVDPAPGVSLAACQELFALEASGGSAAIPMDTKRGDGEIAGWKAGISSKSNASAKVFELFESGEFGNPAGGVFSSRLRLPADWPEAVARLIDYQDGVPGLLKAETDGAPILLWNLQLSPKLSSWSGQSAFVPFLGELLLNSRAGGGGSRVEVLPGSQLVWAPGEGISPESVALFDERGNQLETEMRMTASGAQLSSALGAVPGRYQWKVGDVVVHQQVSNFPPTESDLRLMEPADVQGGEVVDAKALLRRAALGDGIPLWPWFVAAVLLFLLSESLVALWKPKIKKGGVV